MIIRELEDQIKHRLFSGKAIILLGPRQTGKTTLLKMILKDHSDVSIYLNGDDPTIIQLLKRPNTQQLKQLIANSKIVFIDEAQRIPEIGLTSKLIIDQFKSVQLILSGSSAFELSQEMHEPLTGRKWTYKLWPVSWGEWENHIGFLEAEQDLENRLIYGFYPDVLNYRSESKVILKELAESYLYKDILMFGNIKKPTEIQKLLQALAFQIGNEVSMNELSETVGIDSKTVAKYIDILEKTYVIFRLDSFSRNLRNEIKKNKKIYFVDNGIRNAIIGQMQPLALRNDIGSLWENFLISERLKILNYSNTFANSYFWRTRQQQEIDYIEESEGKIYAFEFKWSEKRKVKISKTFTNTYNSQNKIIHRKNFRDFLKL